MKRFPFFLGLAVASVLACISLLTWTSAPPGMRWLGDTIQNPSDAAVYMSYLRQVQDGHVFLSNLFAVEPHAARFDAFWSLLGLITRFCFGWAHYQAPLLAYEATRFVMAIVLTYAVYAAAGWVAKNEADKKLATILAFCGVGMGWLYTVVIDALHLWTPKTSGAMDLASEFAIAPTLLSAAHMILSLALLITALPFIWHGVTKDNRRSTLIGTAACAALFLFHPYFIPLVGIFTLIALGKKLQDCRRAGLKPAPTLIHALIVALSLVPAALVYVPLAFDPVFRTHHLEVNVLPLIPWESSILTLLPFVLALAWRISRRVHLRENEHWLIAWIVAATLCLFLPLPFLRKFTEGLGIALVFLTLPAWVVLRDRIVRTNPSRSTRIYLSAAFLFLAALSPLNLIASQLTLIGRTGFSDYFYRPLPVFATWDYLAATTPTSSIILADDLWTTLWTPAHTGRRVWVAHDHETPSFNQKINLYHELVATTDPSRAQQILKDAGITQFITTSDASTQRYSKLLATGWSVAHSEGSVSVWEPIR